MLKTGSKAPAFELPDQTGTNRSLEEWLSKGPLIIYFYPADFTPVCTAQACAMRDMGESIEDAGVQIVGISPQAHSSHARFSDRFELNFPILADPQKIAIKAYDVDGPLGMGVRRATFWVSQEGVIEDRVLADLFVGSHTAFVRKMIDRMSAA